MKQKTQNKPSSDISQPDPMSEDRFDQYEKMYPGRLRAILEGKFKPDLTYTKDEGDAGQADSEKYINDYHKERSLRLKKEFSEKQPISLEEFVNASKIANRVREQQTSG